MEHKIIRTRETRFLLIWLSLAMGIILLESSFVMGATYGQQVVAAVLLGEAEGEGEKGMIAVAEVIRKRADQKGVSPLAVVKEPKQFSCMNNLTPPQLIRKHWRKKDWELALRIARMMYNTPEKLPGITCGATHYATYIPRWARGHDPVAVIGNHYFWRFEDA